MSSQLREDLLLVEAEEALLVGADLMHVHMVVSGADVLADAVQMALRVGTEGQGGGQVFGPYHLGSLLEMGRGGQLLGKLAFVPALGHCRWAVSRAWSSDSAQHTVVCS